MLTLTRRVGQSIYLDDDICITVYDRMRYHVMMGVLTPGSVHLCLGDTFVRAAVLPNGGWFYLLAMLSGDFFTLDELCVSVQFRPTFLSATSMRKRQMKVSIDAPRSVEILREEIYLQRMEAAGCLPALPFASWLHQANRSVSTRMAA